MTPARRDTFNRILYAVLISLTTAALIASLLYGMLAL